MTRDRRLQYPGAGPVSLCSKGRSETSTARFRSPLQAVSPSQVGDPACSLSHRTQRSAAKLKFTLAFLAYRAKTLSGAHDANLFFDSADNPKHVISTGGRGVCQLSSFWLSHSPPLVSPCCRHTASLSSSSQDMYPYHHSDPHPPVIPGSSDATAHNPRELFVRMPKTVWCQISC